MQALLRTLVTAALLVAVSPPVTRAQSDDERARAHFLAGTSYMDQARYEDAVEQFEESYRLSRRSLLLLNIATANERALRYAEAAAAIERYLEAEPATEDRATLEERLRRLRERAEQQAAAEAPAETQEPEARETAQPARSGGFHLGELAIAGFVLDGLGAAGIAVAIGTGVASQQTYDSLSARCPGGDCPPSAHGDLDSGQTLALVSTISLIAGLACAAAGVTLLIVELTSSPGGEPSGEGSPPAQAWLAIHPHGLSLEGAF